MDIHCTFSEQVGGSLKCGLGNMYHYDFSFIQTIESWVLSHCATAVQRGILLFYQLLPEDPSCPWAPVRQGWATQSGSLSKASSWDRLQWVSNTVALLTGKTVKFRKCSPQGRRHSTIKDMENKRDTLLTTFQIVPYLFGLSSFLLGNNWFHLFLWKSVCRELNYICHVAQWSCCKQEQC